MHRTTIDHKRKVFGTSNLGAPLEVFGIFDPPVKLLLLAGQHGTEPEGTLLLSSTLRSIDVNEIDCAVVPCLNPDGMARGTRGNAEGVDLNRNFPAKNWSSSPAAYHWNDETNNRIYINPGGTSASEPETKALIDLVITLKPACIITLHAPLACIDDPKLSPFAYYLSRESGLPVRADIGYPTPGSLGSWAKEKGQHLITFELPNDTIQNIRKNFSPLFDKLMRGKINPG